MKRIGTRLFGLIILLGAVFYAGLFWFLRNPILPPADATVAHQASAERLEADVRFLASLAPPRNAQNVDGLDKAAAHIASAFAETGCTVSEQPFVVNHTEYRNVICSFGPEDAPRVVIGAHYDVAGDSSPGADDNASGVAGLLDLARLIDAAEPRLAHRLDLVAFTLEEPPHFRTEDMGSHVYARHVHDIQASLKLMISVEMIGFFSDQPGSQDYPLGILT